MSCLVSLRVLASYQDAKSRLLPPARSQLRLLAALVCTSASFHVAGTVLQRASISARSDRLVDEKQTNVITHQYAASHSPHDHFFLCMQVIDCVVFKDQVTGRARYGFLEYARQEDAEKAIELWDGKPLEDTAMIVIKFAKPKGVNVGPSEAPPVRLFVGNIGAGTTEVSETALPSNEIL
jgi:hypothetical protein